MASYREEMADLAGCPVRVLRGGEGPPLLFLHGTDGGGRWGPALEGLAQRFHVIAPEHPGFGRSELPGWLDGIGDLAFYCLDLLDRLGDAPLHLVGVSVGGWIAAEAAIRNTRGIGRLVLAAPLGLRVDGAVPEDIFLMDRTSRLRCLFADPARADAFLTETAEEETDDTEPRNRLALARIGWQPRLHDPDLPKWLHRVDVPTLVLAAERDRLAPPLQAEAFAAAIPGARLECLAECGHLMHLEQPEAFARRVTGFLEEAA